jgi:hypothetical protein
MDRNIHRLGRDQAARRGAGRHEDGLLQVLETVERRWRLRTVLRGLAYLAIAGFALWVISGFGMDRLRFSEGAVTAFRVLTYGGLLAIAVRFLVLPLLRRPSSEDVALYLEEHEPELNARVLSALEAVQPDSPTAGAPGLRRAVVRQALESLRNVENGARIERSRLRRASGILVGVSAATLVLLALGPRSLRTGATALALPTRAATEVSPYSIGVFPGDATIARASDQSIQAEPVGFDADGVELLMRPAGSGAEFEGLPMFPDKEGLWELMLLDVEEDTEYFVRSGRVRSSIHTIRVADLPYVESLSMEYVFPAYTGLDPVTYEDGGDVAALAGTRVNLTIHPTLATPGGELVLGPDGSRIALSPGADGTLLGSLVVSDPGTYRVVLDGGENGLVDASPEYVIDVLTDQPPTISFTEPGRDQQVTSIEEVFLETRVQDDFGLQAVELVFQINASPEETVIPLYRGSGSAGQAGGAAVGSAGEGRDVVSSHTLYLEEYELEPGDLVTYWARARDGRPADDSEVTSDLYFLSIRPFRTDVTQAEGGGQPQGGGGGGGEQQSLVRMQRDVVVGTFNLQRDGEDLDPEVLTAGYETLRASQEQVRSGAETMVGMMGQGLPGGRGLAEIVRAAVVDMEQAEAALSEGRLADALPPETRALRALQQVFEALDEIQVQQGGQGGGGGGGGGEQQEILDQLGLDASEMRSQYESVQRGERQLQDEAIDETLERLKELARRQEQEAERQRRLGGQAGSSGSGDRQRQLAEETEGLARELERLSRETGNREMAETARQLRDAAEDMRRSATRPGDPGAGAEEAADRLDQARRQLEDTRGSRLEQDAGDALRRAQELEARQERMTEDVAGLDDLSSSGLREERLQRLEEEKEVLHGDIEALERDLDRLAARGQQEQPAVARELAGAAEGIRDDKLKEKVQYSEALIRQQSGRSAARFEEEIAGDLQNLRRRLEGAMGSFTESASERADQALEDTRSLVQGLESMERQTREGLEPGQPDALGPEGSEGQQGQGGQQGDQGQPNEQGQGGQRGEQPGGQQGQAGQQGQGGNPQAGAQGGQTGRTGGPMGGGRGDGEPLTEEEIRQMRGEARQRANQAQELRDDLEGQGLDTEALDALIRDLQALDSQRAYDDQAALQELQASIVDEARRFEYALRRALQRDAEGAPGLRGNEAVPSEYRRLVEEYFRALSTGESADAPRPPGG